MVKIGDRIKIIHLAGEDNRYDGHIGVVEHIDSIGQLHLDNCGLAVIPSEDDYIILSGNDD